MRQHTTGNDVNRGMLPYETRLSLATAIYGTKAMQSLCVYNSLAALTSINCSFVVLKMVKRHWQRESLAKHLSIQYGHGSVYLFHGKDAPGPLAYTDASLYPSHHAGVNSQISGFTQRNGPWPLHLLGGGG